MSCHRSESWARTKWMNDGSTGECRWIDVSVRTNDGPSRRECTQRQIQIPVNSDRQFFRHDAACLSSSQNLLQPPGFGDGWSGNLTFVMFERAIHPPHPPGGDRIHILTHFRQDGKGDDLELSEPADRFIPLVQSRLDDALPFPLRYRVFVLPDLTAAM